MALIPTEWDDIPNIDWDNIEDKDVLRFDVWMAIYLGTIERAKSMGCRTSTINLTPQPYKALKALRDNPLGLLYTPLALGETISAITRVNGNDNFAGAFWNHTLDLDLEGDALNVSSKQWTLSDMETATGKGTTIVYSSNPLTALDSISDITGIYAQLKTVIEQQYAILNLKRKPRFGGERNPYVGFGISYEDKAVSNTSWSSTESDFDAASWSSISLPANIWEYIGRYSSPDYHKGAQRAIPTIISDIFTLGYDLSGPVDYFGWCTDDIHNLEVIGGADTSDVFNLLNADTFVMETSYTTKDVSATDMNFMTDSQLSSNNTPSTGTRYINFSSTRTNFNSSFAFVWDLTGVNGFKFRDW